MQVCSAQGGKTQERSLDEQKDEGRRGLLPPLLALPLCHLLICRAERQTLLCQQVKAA